MGVRAHEAVMASFTGPRDQAQDETQGCASEPCPCLACFLLLKPRSKDPIREYLKTRY